MRLTLTDIRNMTDAATLRRGEDYYVLGRVTISRLRRDIIIAEVLGSGGRHYRTELYFSGGDLFANCSCPVGTDCKHGVAVALASLYQQEPTATRDAIDPMEGWLAALAAADSVPTAALKTAAYHLIHRAGRSTRTRTTPSPCRPCRWICALQMPSTAGSTSNSR